MFWFTYKLATINCQAQNRYYELFKEHRIPLRRVRCKTRFVYNKKLEKA